MTPLRHPMPLLARIWLLTALCALGMASASPTTQGQPTGTPTGSPGRALQVLVITGTDPYLPAFVTLDAAMRAAMVRRQQRSVVWLYESIDNIRLAGSTGPALAMLLARKYENVRIDAIVLVSEPAVEFYLRYRDRLGPETPTIYDAVPPAFAGRLPPEARLSGIPTEADFAGTLRIAFALQPRARRLVVVGGVSSSTRRS